MEQEHVQVKIRLPVRAESEARFANHLMATFMGPEVVLTLAQVLQPPITEPDELRQFFAEGYIEAKVLERVIVPTAKFLEFLDTVSKVVTRLRSEGQISAEGGSREGW